MSAATKSTPWLLQWRAAIRDSARSSSERLVAHCLVAFGDAEGRRIYPSAERLAHDSGLSVRTVYSALGALAADGWLEATKRYDARGHQTSNQYALTIPQGYVPDPFVPKRSVAATDAGTDRGPTATIAVRDDEARLQLTAARLQLTASLTATGADELSSRTLQTTTSDEPISDQPSRSSSSVDAGIRIAAGRVADRQAASGGFRSSRTAFIAGVVKSMESEQVDVLRRARSEDWSSERLADALVPPPPPPSNDRVARLPDGRRAFTAGPQGYRSRRVFDTTAYVPARVVA